jgi:hypothetical protein
MALLRTFEIRVHMSATDPKRTFAAAFGAAAVGGGSSANGHRQRATAKCSLGVCTEWGAVAGPVCILADF